MQGHLSAWASHLPDSIHSTESNIGIGEMLSLAKPQVETPHGAESASENNPVTKPVKSSFERDSEDHDQGEGKSCTSKKSDKSESWRKEEKDAKKDKKEKKEKKEGKKKRGPTVCEVTEISAITDKLKLCKVSIHPGTDPVEIVTSAFNVSAGHKFIAAPPGYTTANGVEVRAAKVGGLESAGMFCGPKEMGWDTDILDGDLAIMLADSAEVGSPAPSYEEAVAAFQQREKEAAKAAKDEKKKNKKKGKAEDEDLDELLAEFKVAAPAKPAAAADDDLDAAPQECKLVAADAAQPEGQEDKVEDETIDAKTLANRKKKEKKKAKQQEKTGEGIHATAPEEEQAESKEPASSSSKDEAPAAAEKKGAKKESAVVKAARERLEEKRAFEEAARCRVEEEQRQIDEEQRKREEERQREQERKAVKDAKIAKQKAEGTYLTKKQRKKQREQAERAAQVREQFGYSVAKDGDEEAEETERPQMSPLATKKKKKKRPQHTQETEETAEKETEKPEVEKHTPVQELEEEESDDDDWEKKLEAEVEKESRKVADADTEAESDEDKDSSDSDSSSSSSTSLRAPVITVMGHPDAGKTKTQDKMRGTNVQEGEAGGITQQLGATFLPGAALQEQTKKVDKGFDLEVPGLLIMDTPGHAPFDNLRRRGSSLADLAIVVVDIMKGLEPQTVESLKLLKERRCPFIVALNKIDSLYNWKSKTYTGIQEALGRQESYVRDQFTKRLNAVVLQLNEQGLNCNLYWEHKTLSDFKTSVSLVPMSALTGEGIPDLLYLTLKLTQDFMSDKLEVKEELECTVMEVKNMEGLGTAIDVLLLNGTLKEGDTIVLAGSGGPIVTTIRALLTPQPMKDIRVKNEYVHHKQISTSMSVKISAPGLEDAMPGTQLLVCGPDDDLEDLKEEVRKGFECILNGFQKEPAGVYVKASTLGSLEALLSFLQDKKIPVFDVGIGEVRKKDVTKACIMKEKHPEYAMILAFDVKVNQEAQKQAGIDCVTIFSSDIIFDLQDRFTTHMEKFREAQRAESRKAVVFPAELHIDKQNIFRKQGPILLGCEVLRGQLRVGTPICVPDKENLQIGHVASIQNNNGKSVTMARPGDIVCVKIEQNEAQKHIMYGRHFDHTNKLCSKITRQSIDALKEHFRNEMKEDDWQLVVKLKEVFKIKSK